MGEDDTGREGTIAAEPSFEAGLYTDGVTFERSDAALLRSIDRTGSISGAAEQLDRSYPRTHQRLGDIESAFGPLVEARRGGPDGGGTELTDRARTLLARFERLRSEFVGIATVAETIYEGSIVGRDGEIATVRTPAGKIHALASREAGTVQVTVRADTVTLHDPAAVPESDDTSARNRFRGRILELETRESTHEVAVDCSPAKPLYALITDSSAKQLGLEIGREVVATFKTTATRATPQN